MFWSHSAEDQNYALRIEGQEMSKDWVLHHMEEYFERKLFRELPSCYVNKHSIIGQEDADRIKYSAIVERWVKEGSFNPKELNLKEDELRALGSLMGLSIGDALGASTEFETYDKEREPWIKNDFKDLAVCIEKRILTERHG